ncbi:MAG: FimV/HubP family polar landmark protein [Halioglobus sp.]
MARRLATAVFALSCMHTGVVSALGLGELKLESFLNEPLTATVDIHSAAGLHEDQIRVRLATSEDFEKLGIDRAYFLTSIKFEIQINEQGTGKILVTSEDPVLEPYLDFLIEARWPTGRLLREYTVLVDPPTFDTVSPVISASQRVTETEGGEDSPKKPQGAAASTGTRVTTAKSDLRPGEMPDREFGSNASDSPLAGDQYMIRRDETLWGIALKSKPEGTSVHQTMLDIQRLNPNAFIGGNINRIKAGYIIYLPGSSDISSDNLAGAQKEVQQQNQDWRDGVETESRASSGASLRISAQPTQDQSVPSDESPESVSSYAGAAENTEGLERERTELSDRLAAMEEQVETLQHIVSLKDDQISALQDALANTGAAEGEAELALEESQTVEAADALEADSGQAIDPAPAEVPAVAAPEPAPKPLPAPVAEEPASNTLYYILGLLLAAAGGAFFFWRRRSSADSEETVSETVHRDVFADVKLPDTDVELNDTEIDIDIDVAEEVPLVEPELAEDSTLDLELDQTLDLEPELVLEPEEDDTEVLPGSGYGEGKNDEYASDEAGDALAEADIYIAYGRYPQAVDLLKTAIDNDPRNPAYRVKLVELSAEMGNKDEALLQYNELKDIGVDTDISRAENILRGAGNGSDWLGGLSDIDSAAALDEPLELMADLDLTQDTGETLEADFGELEIEAPAANILDDDLDLSADFGDELLDADDEEDLVFAEGGNEMSTKLDLARAYLDMGDEDGAKQILEEVAVEGSAGQKEEAKILLERLD